MATPEPQPGLLARLARAIDPAKLMFVLALMMLAFGYGLAVMTYRIFPHAIIANAKVALHSLRDVEADDLFASVNNLDAKAPAQPIVKALDPTAGTEHLLITGGPYQFMQRCPTFGCMAWVIDRSGKVLHSWEVDIDALFKDLPELAGRPFLRNLYPSGIALDSDGGLILVIQAKNTFPYQIGVVKIDRSGKVLWKHWTYSHHWPAIAPDGSIFVPDTKQLQKVAYFGGTAVQTRCAGKINNQGISVYSPDGKLLRRIDVLDRIAAERPGLLYGLRDGCDPIHLNSIDIATASVAAAIPGVNVGDLLISLRETSTVAIIDKDDGHFKRFITGRTAAQHSPKFLPDGTALVLDNQGGQRAQGGTRIVRLNFVDGTSETVFPRPGETRELPFLTTNAGHLEISPDAKRAMITGKDPGRSFEIDIASGRPLWSYRSGFDIAPYIKRENIKADTTRAWLRMWGTYYVTEDQFKAAKLGN
jgi:hypothetical protein